MKETSVCIQDFCGGMTHDLYGYVNPVSFWADYYPDRKTTVFGGLWSEIPDLITTHEPSEDDVDNESSTAFIRNLRFQSAWEDYEESIADNVANGEPIPGTWHRHLVKATLEFAIKFGETPHASVGANGETFMVWGNDSNRLRITITKDADRFFATHFSNGVQIGRIEKFLPATKTIIMSSAPWLRLACTNT